MPRFSPILMDHFQVPRNYGRMESADAVGLASLNGEAPQMTCYLKYRGEVVDIATFETSGCGVAIACCSLLSVIVTHRSKADCLALTASDLDAALGYIPVEKKYCAGLAIEALRNALRDCHETTKCE